MGGKYRQATDAAMNALGLFLGGSQTAGVIAGVASPYLNQAIKENTAPNSTANLIAHGVLGAVEMGLQGGNAGVGAMSAMAGEVSAAVIAEHLYGAKDPSSLTESQKETVSQLSQLVGASISGGASLAMGGNSYTTMKSADLGKNIAENAVENNYFKQAMENPSQLIQLGILNKGNDIKKDIEEKVTEEVIEEIADATDKYAPHYISINGQIYGIGAKTAINLRSGDIVAGWTFSPVALPTRFGVSANANLGWITNLELSDLKTAKGERKTAQTINGTIEGNAIGASACYKLGCIGYSQTIPNSKNDKKYHSFEVGIGTGGSGGGINQERTYKIENVSEVQ
ncbi:VENN motif pre-toxin domain-containing protein [Actinobacillus vicugnae]|uniref:VENN motif pre-toxin domain-containing protein n=1 Tax=Actinobacillus vicugnae TaxID=2573093 RepID=UPI001241572A|nr:VENN motif pre-toxin domain-containing protein [Actinobacillus vicugnae]